MTDVLISIIGSAAISFCAAALAIFGYKVEILNHRPDDPGRGIYNLQSFAGLFFFVFVLVFLIFPPVSSYASVHLQLLAGLLLASAWLDYMTKWSPDVLLWSLVIAACFIGPVMDPGAGGLDILVSLFIASGLILFARVLWGFQVQSGIQFLPPPDIVAISLPLVIFGISFTSASVYLMMAVILLVAIRVSRETASKDVAGDLPGLEGRVVIPVLPVTNITVLLGVVHELSASEGVASSVVAKMLSSL